jgi:uncharacterized membrane protein (UPF0127 family)
MFPVRIGYFEDSQFKSMPRSSILSFYLIRSGGICIALSFILIFISTEILACPLELPAATISIKGHTLAVELATTPKARVCGLSHRVQLPANHGMLFIYPTLGPRTFWMKDTHIPLSISFIDDSGRISSIQHMTPMQTAERYRSLQPVRYVLEVNQGWFAEHGIGVGDIVEMKLPLVIEIR